MENKNQSTLDRIRNHPNKGVRVRAAVAAITAMHLAGNYIPYDDGRSVKEPVVATREYTQEVSSGAVKSAAEVGASLIPKLTADVPRTLESAHFAGVDTASTTETSVDSTTTTE